MSEHINKLAVSYARVSSDGQVTDGMSLDIQRDRIPAWCQLYGHTLIGSFADEGISGKDIANRPGLLAALDMVCANKAALVVTKLDRLGRNLDDLRAICRRLEAAGASLVSLAETIDTSTAAGRMFFSLLGLFAEFERARMIERVQEAMDRLKREGRCAGQTPFGWRKDQGKLIPHIAEQQTIERILSEHRGGAGYRAIARMLNTERVPAKSKGCWHPSSVKCVITRAKESAQCVATTSQS